ncbi:hypothetical protein N7462_000900 [Penicillium macrosclerotiorum]|uniref:uncharacterized protein n=1 Tax=Penicillium macrosclerotiorum TaxID=303699 RepID=UPI002549B43F|nr:uncharacterized protein N7462_000900 [Penicillium macrosclerotiorum]KAJ5698895.1 hypothetical protein N7462_000900 [Penicillium macrosclerotiorum]
MGSSADIIILSSSPPSAPMRTPTKVTNAAEKLFDISPQVITPPSIPSPSELFQHPPSRSRFFPTLSGPDDATKKQPKSERKIVSRDTSKKDAPSKPRKKKEKATKEQLPHASEDLRPESVDVMNVAKKATGPQKQKSRTQKTVQKKGAANMLLSGKVTKAGSDAQTKKLAKSIGENAKLLSPDETTEIAISNQLGTPNRDHLLHLNEAIRRRMDWTPPRERTANEAIMVDHHQASNNNSGSSTKGSFGSLLSDYNYSGSTSDFRETPTVNVGGPTKRRRIELVDPQLQSLLNNNHGSNDASPAQEENSSSSEAQLQKKARKTKKPKRLTTLTARMTAQYTLNDTAQENFQAEDNIQETAMAKTQRSKANKNSQNSAFTVLSPEDALKALDDQDLIFGTCSQLEREESPQTLLEMQNTILASENLDFEERGLSKTSRSTSAYSVPCSTREVNLWCIAARDMGGSLVQAKKVDSVDLTDTNSGPEKGTKPKLSTSTNRPDEDWFDLDYGKPVPSSRNMASAFQKPLDSGVNSRQPAIAASSILLDDPQPPATVQEPEPSLQQPIMPQYNGFTDAELSKQVTAFGFKSIRGRKKMIDLLQKCWESKHGKLPKPQIASSQSQPISEKDHSIPKSKVEPKGKTTSKKRADTIGQPKSPARFSPQKHSSTKISKSRPYSLPSSFMDVEEIQDSEDEAFPSPSQIQKRYTDVFSSNTLPSGQPCLDFVTSKPPQSPTPRRGGPSKASNTTKPTLSSTSRESSLPDLSDQITKAVKAQPRPRSSLGTCGRLTWHEKILMYDPIILEDLTTWLNVEGFGLVGEDREIWPSAVREWCESKGICCCWKKNASW